jgi:HAD superfamily hydrolase (TIGR01450 family)
MTTTTTAATNCKPIKAVLIDLSGTLHIGDQPVPGAQDALNKLRQSGRRIRFLTNTSTKSTTQLLNQLNNGPKLHFQIPKQDLMTSVLATVAYIQKHKLKPLCLMEDISDMPLEVQEIQPSLPTTTAAATFSEGDNIGNNTTVSSAIDRFDSVVVGLAPSHFNYAQLNTALRILIQQQQQQQQKAQKNMNSLIAIHRANYIRDSIDGELSLGPGAFVTALEMASSNSTSSSSSTTTTRPTTTNTISAKVMGKPSREFFQSAMWDDIDPEEICMIGDDVVADIGGAQNVGIGTTILVQTGKYRPGDEDKIRINDGGDKEAEKSISSNNILVCPSIVEAVEYILSSPSN